MKVRKPIKKKPVKKITKPPKRKIKAATEVVVILDRSGSMGCAKSDHEGGLKTFVAEQRKVDDNAKFTLVQFDDQEPCEIIYDAVAFDDVKSIKLNPRGCTPLYDAIGKATSHVESRLAGTKDVQVLVAIVTDGQENASRDWNKGTIKKRIESLESAGWKFVFLGANIDSAAEAGKVGIDQVSAMNYQQTSGGIANAYRGLSDNTRSSRTLRAQGASLQTSAQAMSWTDQQRKAANSK